MAKSRSKNKSLNSKNKQNLIIVGAVVLLIGVVAFFAEKQNMQDSTAQTLQINSTGVNVVHLKPDQGCRILEPQEPGAVTSYECNLLVKNTENTPLEWVGQIDGLEGAMLTNNGEGSIEPNSNTVIQLWVPVKFCDENPQGKGTVTIMDAEKSSDQSLASFYCSDVPGEGDAEAALEE